MYACDVLMGGQVLDSDIDEIWLDRGDLGEEQFAIYRN